MQVSSPQPTPQVRYFGLREHGAARVFGRNPCSSMARELPLRLDLYRHSPSGPEWGYRGSGPAQLALAILADFLGVDRQAMACYQRFRHAVVANLPYEHWTLDEAAAARALTVCQGAQHSNFRSWGMIQRLYRLRLGELAERARAYARAAKAPLTLRADRSDWQYFTAWCGEQGYASLPAEPETVALYLAARAAERANATLTRRLTSITKAHEAAGCRSPATMQQLAVSETLKGIRRTYGVAQRRKQPLLTADMQQLVAHSGRGSGNSPRCATELSCFSATRVHCAARSRPRSPSGTRPGPRRGSCSHCAAQRLTRRAAAERSRSRAARTLAPARFARSRPGWTRPASAAIRAGTQRRRRSSVLAAPV